MCEAVEEYAKEYVTEKTLYIVENLIKNANFTLEQALDAAGIQGEDRKAILTKLKEK